MTSRGAAPPFSREASRPGHFDGDYVIGFIDGSLGNDYGLAPDGRFLMLKRGPAEQGPLGLRVVLNSVDELARRVPKNQ